MLVGLLISTISGGTLLAGFAAIYGHGLVPVFFAYQMGGMIAAMSFLLVKLQNQNSAPLSDR